MALVHLLIGLAFLTLLVAPTAAFTLKDIGNFLKPVPPVVVEKTVYLPLAAYSEALMILAALPSFNLTNCTTCLAINSLATVLHVENTTIAQAVFYPVLFAACSQSIFTPTTIADCQAEAVASGNGTFVPNIFNGLTPFTSCTLNTSYCTV